MARCNCIRQGCFCVLQVGDTDCIDLEISGDGSAVSPFFLTATPIIDPDPNNQVVCNPNGLFADFAGISTLDTDCIDLEGDGSAGNPLTATPIIDPDFDNVLQCRINGLFVPAPSGNAVSTTDSDCIDFSGTGANEDPLTADLVISPSVTSCLNCSVDGLEIIIDSDPDNLLSCGVSGLIATISTLDTDCIAITGNGTEEDPLTADLIISPAVTSCLNCSVDGLEIIIDPDPDNLLSCGVSGLFVPSSSSNAISTLDSDCIDFSGDGTAGDPLTADLIISPAVTSCLNCSVDGLEIIIDPDPDNLISCGVSGLIATGDYGVAPTESFFGDEIAEGTSTQMARADHLHGRTDDAALFWSQVSL